MKIKNVVKYLLFLGPWFLSSLFSMNSSSFYKSLNLPVFAPPSILFPIVWTILFILISISIYKVWDYSSKEYKLTLLINYILNQLFTISFFVLKSPFLGFANSLAVFVSTLFLYFETNEIDKKASKLLIPYIIWGLFASFLSLFIYFMNS